MLDISGELWKGRHSPATRQLYSPILISYQISFSKKVRQKNGQK